MERQVLVGNKQRVTSPDYLNVGEFPRQSFDHFLKDTGPGKSFTGFAVVAGNGPAKVVVGAGRLYTAEGPVFFNDDTGGVEVDMLAQLPVVTRRICAIVVWGNTIETAQENRTFLVDAVSRDTIGRLTPTESRRRAEVGPVYGIEGPDPVAPALAANVLPVAYVLLGPGGVISITAAAENRSGSLRENTLAIKENLLWRARTGTQIDTLGSDISALAGSVKQTAPFDFVQRVVADVARLKERSGLPATYTSYAAAHYLTEADSQVNHVDHLAYIDEGIRFPKAAAQNDQIALLNPAEPKVTVQGNFVLPSYTQVTRVPAQTADGEIAIANASQTTQTIVQRSRTVTRTRTGAAFTVCTNGAFWQTGVFDWNNWTFYQGGAVYNVINEYTLDAPGGWAHNLVRLQQVWTDIVEEPYWDYNTTTQTATGALLAQTFLNTQDGWLTSVNVYLSKVGTGGDLRMVVCECLPSGQPNLNATVAQMTKAVADLKVGLNNMAILPTFLKKGTRYALVFITAGNHFFYETYNNKFPNGTRFQSTDGGGYFVGDLFKDICFELLFAKFDSSYVEVDLAYLSLSGGIGNIDITADACIMPGTTLTWMIKTPGSNTWLSLNGESGPNVLAGLPPLVQFRAVLKGTPDNMPGFGVGSTSRARYSRCGTTFKDISPVRTLPAPCTQITVLTRLEAWQNAVHTNACKLRTGPLLLTGVGDTIVNPSAVVDTVSPDDPTGMTLIRKSTFVLGSAVSSFRIEQRGTTSNALTLFHVAERVDIELP